MGRALPGGIPVNIFGLLLLAFFSISVYVGYNSMDATLPKLTGNIIDKELGLKANNSARLHQILSGDQDINTVNSHSDLEQEHAKTLFNSPSQLSAYYSTLPSGGPEDEPPKTLPSVEWVFTSGHLLQRLEAYNDRISQIRQEILIKRGNNSSWSGLEVNLDVLWMNTDDWMEEVSKYSQVRMVALIWDGKTAMGEQRNPFNDTSNLLIQSYYSWSANAQLCGWIRTPRGTKARWDAVYGRKCSSNFNLTRFPIPLEPAYLHGKPINKAHYWPHAGLAYPHYFYTCPPRHVLYLNIIQDAVVTTLGDFISGNLKLVLYSCSQDLDPRAPKDYESFPLYNEVFVISQYWGESYFHRFVESFPRIAPYLAFLKQNVAVKVLISETGEHTMELMSLLGLTRDRFITGAVRAKVVYIPQATPCGFAQVQGSQLLSRLLREELHRRHGQEATRSLVLIKRSNSRRFTQQSEIEDILQQLSRQNGLRYELFPDNPPPNLSDTMRLFNRALILVGPHGAGLANLMFVEPGAFVIEGVCNRPHVNLCFQRLAHVLGHHYYGIASRGGCEDVVDVNSIAVRQIVSEAIRLAQETGSL